MERLDRRQLLLREARRSFETFGFKRTVIDDIVRAAGISKGAFYLEFKSKEELFLEVIKTERAKALQQWQQMLDAETTILGKLRVTLTFSLTSIISNRLFSRLYQHDDELRIAMGITRDQALKNEFDQYMHMFKGFFEEGIASGELRPDLNAELMPLVFGSLKGAAGTLLQAREVDLIKSIDVEEFIAALADMAILGIAGPEAAGRRGDDNV